MQFEFDKVKSCVDKIEKELKNLNTALADLKDGLEFITDSTSWKSQTHDSFSTQVEELYANIENVSYVSSNVNAYLEGVLNNYSAFNQKSSSFLDFMIGTQWKKFK